VPEKQDWRFNLRGALDVALILPLSVLALVSSHAIEEDTFADFAFNGLAWVTSVSGAALRFWATLYLGGRKSRTVVATGPYSVCRNPLYWGSLLLGLSGALFLKSLVLTGGVVLIACLYVVFTVPSEERHLREKLGGEYFRYCEKVPRFGLRISTFETPDVLEVRLKALATEAKRALGWVWIPLFAEILSHLRGRPWWIHWGVLP
jgi:protein-S-isoprenylcysteine O-methyltransferase Ste14